MWRRQYHVEKLGHYLDNKIYLSVKNHVLSNVIIYIKQEEYVTRRTAIKTLLLIKIFV